jgi:hypothetical protein
MDEQVSRSEIQKPPSFLRVITTLSMVNGAYGMVSGRANAISPPDVNDQMIEDIFTRLEGFAVTLDEIRPQLETFLVNTMLNMGNIGALSFLFYGMSFIGAWLMLRANRNGFTLYVVAQIGLAFVPSFFGGLNSLGWANFTMLMVWNGIWVAMYASQRKHFG